MARWLIQGDCYIQVNFAENIGQLKILGSCPVTVIYRVTTISRAVYWGLTVVWLSKSTLLPDEDLRYVVETSQSIMSKWQLWDLVNPLYTLSTMIKIFHDVNLPCFSFAWSVVTPCRRSFILEKNMCNNHWLSLMERSIYSHYGTGLAYRVSDDTWWLIHVQSTPDNSNLLGQ